MDETKLELSVVALSASESSPGNYALVLEETQSRRRIPMIIGAFEAQSVAVYMEQMRPARPLSHDVYKQTLDQLGVNVVEALIYQLDEGIFYTRLLLRQGAKEFLVEARASDAIAIALRAGAPVYAYAHVVELAGFLSEVFLVGGKHRSISRYSVEDLEELLARLLEKEDYESAERIRQMIHRRQVSESGEG
jgi:hypothetical protein